MVSNQTTANNSHTRMVRQTSSEFITHADLLRLALKNHCEGIDAEPVLALCIPQKNFWVFKCHRVQVSEVPRLRRLWRCTPGQCLASHLQ
jgi:hypothetical protein